MAEEIKIPVSIDLTSLRAGLNELKSGIDKARGDIAQALTKLSVNIDGKAAVNELKGLSSTFGMLKDAASSSLNEQKAALASLIVSGQRGSEAYKQLVSSIQATTAEANKLDDAVKQVDADTQKVGKGGGLSELKNRFAEGQAAASTGGGMFGDIANKVGQLASPIGLATAGIGALTLGINQAMESGQKFETGLQAVSAVTGLTGSALDDIGERAKDLASRFGGEASTQLSAFQGVLSKFGADLAKTPNELGKVSENINILAKAGGLDAAQAMDTLANSMLQFGVKVSDGKVAAEESARYMNVLAASARVGAAEIPQVGEAVLVAGVAAKQANLDFEQTNAAIQVLAAGGKVGAEAGVALRNVLGKMAGADVIPKEAAQKLAALGVDYNLVADKSKTFEERLQALKPALGDATALAQVFGTENAAAAAILIGGAETVGAWTKEVTGTDDATQQAAKNMNTLANRIDVLKSNIQNALIGAFQKIAPALSFVIDNLGTIAKVVAPVVAAFVTMAIVSQAYAAAMGVITFIKGVYATVTGVATAATTIFGIALNTATGGLLLVVGAIAALVAGYVLFSKTSEEAAQASLDQAKASKEVVASQIKDNETKQINAQTTQELVKRYQDLASKTNLTKKEQDELRDITGKLDKQYPSLIDQTKSFKDNLGGVAEIGKQSTAELKNLKNENDNLQKSLAESNKMIIGATRNVAVAGVDTAIDEVYKLGNAFNSQANQAEFTLQRFNLSGRLFAAKNDAEIETVRVAFMEQLNKLQGAVGDQNYLAIAGAATKAVEATKQALREWSGEIKTEADKAEAGAAGAADAAKKPDDKDKKGKKDESELSIAKNEIETAKQLAERANEKARQDIIAEARANNTLDTLQTKLKLLDQEKKFADELLKITTDTFKAEGEGADVKVKRARLVDPKEIKDAEQLVVKAQNDTFKVTGKLREDEAKAREDDAKKQLALTEKRNKAQADLNKKLEDDRIALIADVNERELQEKLTALNRRGADERAKIAEQLAENLITTEQAGNARLLIDQRIAQQSAAIWKEYNDKVKKSSGDWLKDLSDAYIKAFSDIQISIAPSAEEIERANEAAQALKNISDQENDLDVQRVRATESLDSLASKQQQINDDRIKAEEDYAAVATDGWSRVKRSLQEALQTTQQATLQSANASITEYNTKRGAAIAYDKEIAELQARQAAGEQLLESEKQKIAGAETQRGEQSKEINKANELAWNNLAAGAAAAGVAVLASGGSMADALKESAKQAVMGLIEMYRFSIIALVSSVIPPPLGLVAGEAAVQLLKAGATAALGSFEVGGFTSNVGTKTVAGVVHGGEYVANAQTTNRERALFEHFERGGTSESFYMSRYQGVRGFEEGGFVSTVTGDSASIIIDVKNTGIYSVIANGLRAVYDEQLTGLQAVTDFTQTEGVAVANLYAGLKTATTSLFAEKSKASYASTISAISDYAKEQQAYNELLRDKEFGVASSKDITDKEVALGIKRSAIYTGVANGIAEEAASVLIAGGNVTQAFEQINDTISSLLSTQAEASKTALQTQSVAMTEVLQQSQQLEASRKEKSITEEEATIKQNQLNEQSTKIRQEQFTAIETQAATSFASLVMQGENVGTALKQTAGGVVTSLVDMYAPSIIALFSSIIPPPFGFAAGTVAVAGIKSLLSQALSQFESGGFTADVGTSEVAGVVHGREFVANAGITKRERGLFEFMHAGGTSEQYFEHHYLPRVLEMNKINTTISKVTALDNTAMLMELRSLREAVRSQTTRVDNYSNVSVDLDGRRISRKIISDNNYNLRRL